ncbi:MAG: 2-hydroxychromene-2-carboxylate isomerase [Hyphomicrobiaceae bacterium]|nr:2-hydroxychromene-2-carboxylate isomerase [Hyphomicrobiaceae bacterium]
MPRLEFWYELASNYSYLSAMRIAEMAERAGVEVVWRPFLLGPIFKSQGWETSPFNIYPAKGRYMVRDMQRLAAGRGLSFMMPPTFPANGLRAARLALVGAENGWIEPFTRAVFEAEFARGADIFDRAVLADVLSALGLDAEQMIQSAEDAAVKQRLKDQTAEAATRGIFGAPTFIAEDGELFWGDDRLEQAVGWAAHPGTNVLPSPTRIGAGTS